MACVVILFLMDELKIERTGKCGLNVYLWSVRGKLIGEFQRSFTHEILRETTVDDLFGLNPGIEPAWERALEGHATAWLEHNGEIMLAAFIPWAPVSSLPPLFVIGIAGVLGDDAKEWLDGYGVEIPSNKP